MFRSFRITICIAAGCLLLTPTAALARAKPQVRIDGSCTGDSVAGSVVVRRTAGMSFALRLLQRPQQSSGWVATGRARTFPRNAGPRRYPYVFDISRFDAFAYRLAVDGNRGRVRYRALSPEIEATSCAPGHDVPEAPLALLLPLSLLATGSLLLVRRRVHA